MDRSLSRQLSLADGTGRSAAVLTMPSLKGYSPRHGKHVLNRRLNASQGTQT
jgi:hypothetical protein